MEPNLLEENKLILFGHDYSNRDTKGVSIPIDFPVRCTFESDKPAHVGIVSTKGELYFITRNEDSNPSSRFSLERQGDDDSPILSYAAVTATNRTCISFLQSPASQLIHLLEFEHFSDFLHWFSNPSSFAETDLKQPTHYMVQGRITGLHAGATSFTMLTEAGNVYTWTNDARHNRCLGRSPNEESPSDRPGLIDALGGVPISKVAVGGWMSAALSQDKDVYVWGREKPKENPERMAALPGNDEDLKLVDLGDDIDFEDVGVGSGHAVLLASNGKVFVAGENDNGQFGFETNDKKFESDWREIEDLRDRKVKQVWCGYSTTFALVAN
ncbi:RCC1/BLIP-II [Rhizodiscina lignyota]|uniref:RCC1/BLIP-II n=1 Tax=Rhizodiscina lignyota TaxID=1504668 RepID=A0A9P4M4C6_9PEZI|nr:RCC1/BLIP-II [Rhizodiscina lignyota]